jgi:hypothetical protein
VIALATAPFLLSGLLSGFCAVGDVLGLTPVHVDRVMMEPRHQGLIEWKGAQVAILDWDQLATFAEFDPI